MADKPLKPVKLGFHDEFGWFIWGLVGLGVLWFWTGGYNNQSAHNGAYIKPPAPLDSGETYGNYYAGRPTPIKETLNLPESPAILILKTESAVQALLAKIKAAPPISLSSPLAKRLFIDGIAGAKISNPGLEYIRIAASDKNLVPVKISGLRLDGAYFDGLLALPQAGGTQNIYLAPGGRAIIATGNSPIGISFRVNACSNYLAGASKLIPALRQSTYGGSMTYDQCVIAHKNDVGFDSKEWRIFLGQKNQLWGDSSDSIRLVDVNGKVVDALQY